MVHFPGLVLLLHTSYCRCDVVGYNLACAGNLLLSLRSKQVLLLHGNLKFKIYLPT